MSSFIHVGIPCGGSENATTGDIFSPNYPRNYNSRTNCQYVIYVPPTKRPSIRVTFQDFALEDAYDFLYYGAGDQPNLSEALGQLTGLNTPEDIMVEGSAMWFWLASDSSVTFRGFALTWDGSG